MTKSKISSLNLDLIKKAQMLAKKNGNYDKNEYLEQIIQLNQPLIVTFMKNNLNIVNQIKTLAPDDIFQCLTIALCKAVKYFDSSMGYSFSSFAMTCFKKYLLQILRKENVLKRKDVNNTISLDENLTNNENENFSLKDVIEDPNSSNMFDHIDSKMECNYIFKRLSYFFDKKDLYILQLAYSKNETFKNISKKLNLSKQNLNKQINLLYKNIKTCYDLSNLSADEVEKQNFNARKMRQWAIGKFVFKNDINISVLFNYLPNNELLNAYKSYIYKIFKTDNITPQMQNKLYDFTFTPQEAQFLQFRFFDKMNLEFCKKIFGEKNFIKIEKIVLEKLYDLYKRIQDKSFDITAPLKYTTNSSKEIIKINDIRSEKIDDIDLYKFGNFINAFIRFPYYKNYLSEQENSFIEKYKNRKLDIETINDEQNYKQIISHYNKFKILVTLIKLGLNIKDIQKIFSDRTANLTNLTNQDLILADFLSSQEVLIDKNYIDKIKRPYHTSTLDAAYKLDLYYLQKVGAGRKYKAREM